MLLILEMSNLKKALFYVGLVALIATLSFGCKKERSSKATTSTVVNVMTTGTWTITLMSDSGIDQTNDFVGYSFVFNTNGELTAARASGTTVGSWYAEIDDHGENEFRIAIGYVYPLNMICKRWHVLSSSPDKLELNENESMHQEYLTFKKL